MHSPTFFHTNQGARLKVDRRKNFHIDFITGRRAPEHSILDPAASKAWFSPTHHARISLSPDFTLVVVYGHDFYLPGSTKTATSIPHPQCTRKQVIPLNAASAHEPKISFRAVRWLDIAFHLTAEIWLSPSWKTLKHRKIKAIATLPAAMQ